MQTTIFNVSDATATRLQHGKGLQESGTAGEAERAASGAGATAGGQTRIDTVAVSEAARLRQGKTSGEGDDSGSPSLMGGFALSQSSGGDSLKVPTPAEKADAAREKALFDPITAVKAQGKGVSPERALRLLG